MATILFLLVAGALLLLLEPLFPHLVAATLGLICWTSAIVLTYAWYGSTAGNWTLSAALASALAGTWWYLERLPRSRMGRSIQSGQASPTETAAPSHLLNHSGTALTPLRPGGTAEIAGERVDVVTSGEPLERGQKITVVRVDGSRVLVRAL